ncbi:MAG: allantoate amidohydrolase [Burkholderiales bacterium]|nr:allantoate amidohydrolase [Burkholderiales bacterium]
MRIDMRHGQTILEQAEMLGAITQDPGRVTRTYLTPQHRAAGERILAWMREAGMEAAFDALGNVVGRYAALDPEAPIVMTGSHMDSVVNAGKYDGVFGILTAIACVRDLHARGKRLPVTFEVVAFGDEEGVRFGVTLIGSKTLGGNFDPAYLDRKDADGITLRDALRNFGGDPDALVSLERNPRKVAAFVESHIEQGPVLLNEGLPVGVVTSIAGGTRVRVRITGLAGHAGTVPMPGRRDALAAAAEMVLAVERYCLERADTLVGTVGKLGVPGGGAINVIPGEVEFNVDLRSGDDAKRLAALAAVEAECAAIAARRGVALAWEPFFHVAAAPCDPQLQARLAESIAAQGCAVRYLPSGAGHDAMEMVRIAPIAMLFVRCGNGGISHNPLETMTAEDAETATAVLLHFLEHFEPAARGND